MNKENEAFIARLVGPATPEQLRYVDAYFGVRSALFMPVAGPCFYALSENHAHPGYMFVAPFDDRSRVVVGDAEIVPLPDRVLAMSPQVLHHELPGDEPPRYVAVMIEPFLFDKEWRRYRSEVPIFRGKQFPRAGDFLPLVRRYMAESGSGSPGRAAVMQALEVELCHALIRAVLQEPVPLARGVDRLRVSAAIEAMHTRLSEKLSIETLAATAGLSVTHFRRVFSIETGTTPADYLRRARLERAKKLIVAGDHTLTEVALECGLGSSAYLSATFSRAFGISPAGYRMLVAEGRNSQKKGRKTKA